jgi:small-conductance mechanosensitive channel
MKEFLDKVVLSQQGVTITTLDLILIGLLIVITMTINFFVGRFVRKSTLFENLELSRKRLIFNVFRVFTWLISVGLILGILGIDLSKFLNFYLIGSDDPDVTFVLQPKTLIGAAVVLLFTKVIITALERIFGSWSHFREDDKGRSKAIFKFLSYIIWIVAVLLILSSTGINLTIIWGAGAALLVGVGFGLQQIISDLVSGVFLLFEGNLREGDIVELNNGTIGQVEHVGIRTTKLLTRDDYMMIIPNSQFIVEEVINWTHNEENTRFHVQVGVAYGSDTRLVEKVLLESAKNLESISDQPAPFVRFYNFGESSLDFQLFFWSRKTFRIENIKSELRFSIDQNFRKNGIQIPFPQRDLHIRTK